MRTIAVMNQKGGCGKTTTAINLAACLARKNKNVLLVDLDPQAHATLGLGIGGYRYSTYDLLTAGGQGQPAAGDAVIEVSRGLSLIPSDVMLGAAEPSLLARDHREYRLSDVLVPLSADYDFCIIDCPPNIGILTFNALFACTEIIIPMETGLFAIHGLAKLMETVDLVETKRNRKIAVNVLLTMFDRRTRIAYESLHEVQKYLGGQVFTTVVNFNVRLKEAASHGKPVITYAPESAGARDYMDLAEEVVKMRVKKPSRIQEAATGEEGILFSCYAPGAGEVYVVADFNGWQPGRTPLEHVDGSGVWKKVIPLKKGRYEYKFLVDGAWVTDPANPRTSRNEFGENSLIEID
jgi:chromosome partitioning protein